MHFAYALQNFRGGYALISDSPDTDKAAVFVHGFAGGPASTWVDFQGLVDSGLPEVPEWWQTTDMYFYTYESVDGSLEFNTLDLKNFVSQMFPEMETHRLIEVRKNQFAKSAPYPFRSLTRSYSKLVFVGHSEGAVIIRKLIVSTIRDLEYANSDIKNGDVIGATLNLFSPAILGFSPSGGYALLLELDLANAKNMLRAHNELKYDSPLLGDLKSATVSLAKQYPDVSALRAWVGFGGDERIVYIGNYLTDPEVVKLTGSHTSVCKPDADFMQPFEFVKEDAPKISKSVSAPES